MISVLIFPAPPRSLSLASPFSFSHKRSRRVLPPADGIQHRHRPSVSKGERKSRERERRGNRFFHSARSSIQMTLNVLLLLLLLLLCPLPLFSSTNTSPQSLRRLRRGHCFQGRGPRESRRRRRESGPRAPGRKRGCRRRFLVPSFEFRGGRQRFSEDSRPSSPSRRCCSCYSQVKQN